MELISTMLVGAFPTGCYLLKEFFIQSACLLLPVRLPMSSPKRVFLLNTLRRMGSDTSHAMPDLNAVLALLILV